MMTYTRSAIGLLTRQYKAVLKKCFLINMGLFALGAVSVADANAAAAPKPTLDDMQSNASTVMPTLAGKYDLATEKGENTRSIVVNNTTYYYTPNENTQAKLNMLDYLAGSAPVAIKEDTLATEDNYLFKIGSTYYTFDTTKLPTSVYTGSTYSDFAFKNNPSDIATFTTGASDNYDVAVRLNDDTTKYYNIAIDPTKASHVGSKLSNIDWPATASDTVTIDIDAGTVTSAIRFKIPHNGTLPNYTSLSKLNKCFTYTYTKPTGYGFINDNGSTISASSAGTSSQYNVPTDGRSVNVVTNAVGATIATGNQSITNKIYAKNGLHATLSAQYNIIGGNAILNQGTIGNVVADFVGNRGTASGSVTSNTYIMGVIANVAVTSGVTAEINSIMGDFLGNSSSGSPFGNSVYGGAISNYVNVTESSAIIGSLVGDFIGNSVSVTNGETRGGAISNYATNGTASIGSIKSDFVGNRALSTSSSSNTKPYGGAISNQRGTISSIMGNFLGNSASSGFQAYGGAISNRIGTMGSIVGNFVGNSVSTCDDSTNLTYAYGGAIYNDNSSAGMKTSIDSIIGNFVGNSANASNKGIYYGSTAYGGAIYNYATYGTASIGSIVGDFIGNSAFANANTYGGAIDNYAYFDGSPSATIGSIVGDFIGNSANSSSSGYYKDAISYGGAVSNRYAIINSIVGDFVGNSATSSSDPSYSSYAYGGAICNYNTSSSSSRVAIIDNIVGDFVGNYAKTSSSDKKAYGGAIFNGKVSSNVLTYNANARITLSGNTFTGNYIDNNGTITPNSIYNAGVINIRNGATVTVNDGYDSMSEAILNIGSSAVFNLNGTEVAHNIGILNNSGAVNLSDNVTTNANGLITGSSGNINLDNNAVFNINENNGKLQTDSLGTVTNNGTINWDLDVKFNGSATPQADQITLGSISGTQSIIINAINLMVEPTSIYTVNVATAGSVAANALTIVAEGGILKTQGATQWWNVTYTKEDGLLHFAPGEAPVLDTLVSWIAKDAQNKEYTLAANGELVEGDLKTLVNNKLTVTGNGISGKNWVRGSNTYAGVSLGATTQTLELKDIDEWSGFTGNAVNNDANGTVKVENVTFKDNTTADIANAGKLEFKGTNSLEKITGDGDMEVKSGTTTVGSLAQGTLTVTSGELKNNGASTVGGGSNAGTISGTGSLTTTGAFENKSGATISQAVNHNGTNAFTNNGTISGAVDNSGTFINNSTLSSTLTNSGTFTNGNNGTITGAVTNTGTMTSAAEKMTGSVANNAGGTLNLSGTLAKEITGTGTTNVNSTLAMNSGAGVAGTLNMNGGTVTISNNAITSHNVGELKGNGNIAIDINYGGTGITSDEIYVTSDAQDSTLTISSLTESGTRAANFEKQILFGTDGSTKLALSTAVLNQFNKTHDAVDMQKDSGLNTNNTLWNKTYGTEHWTEYYDRTLSVNSSGNSIVYESVKTGGTDHTWNPEYDTLALMNQYEGTGYENRKIDFTGIHADDEAQGVYTLSAALGETKAGRLTLDGEKNTTTGALTVVDLNGNAGFNLTNATELVLDEVKLTGASGNNVITASNDGASVSLNDAYVDGNIVKNGGEKMTVTTTETTTLAGNTTNVSLTNSGTLTNNGTITGDVENSGIFTNNSTITGDVTNTGTMTSSANKLGGAIANNGDGVLNLSGTLAKEITGTGTTKVDSALTLAEGAEIAGKLDMNDGTVTMSSDSKYKSYTVGTLKNSGNIAIDAKASTADTDSFALSGAESGASIHISSLTFDKSDLTEGQDYEQKMHVLTGNGSVALTLDDSIANAHKETHYKISDLKGTDSVNDKDVAWNETFGNWKKERYKDATLAVNGKDLVYTVSHTFGDKTYTSNSEGLKELNVFNAGTETKTFNAEADGKEHRIIEDLGNTVGKLSIDGKGGTLDFDGKKGFVMGSGTEVSLKDVTAKNADKLADVKSGATLNLEDVTLENNGLLQNAGTINLSGVNSIDSIITGMGADATLNVNSDWEIDTTVTGHQVNVNGVKLTVGAGNLVGSDNLNVKDGAEVDITNSHITVGDANFESGSKLSLKVNSLGDFGAFTANKIAVANEGTKLSVTLAQGIQNGSVQLLKVTSTAPEDQNFNTFEDITDNNMYIFEKADKNGLYNIRLAKTAEEIVEESGGTANEARAAGAWVDGNEFAEGTVTKEIADTLADLAQNDVQALKDALEVITPVEAPATQENLSEFSDRLMLEVNNHLSINEISGLSSGDELSGVTLWAKGYYGKSKLNSHKNIKGFDTKKKGVIAGIDKKLDNNIKVGVGFQYENGDVDAFRRDTDINTLVGFVYSEYKPSDWFVRGVASYGSASYDESKYALGINIKDKYHADVYSLQALTGYDLKYVTPEVGARYYYIKRHGYSDNIGQQMSGNNMDLLRGVMGLRTSYRYGMFKPEIYAGITYDFVSDEDNATISLPNGENYLVNGKRLNRFGTELNASVEAYITDELSATLGYEGKFRSHYKDHSGIVNVKYEF